MKYENLVTSFVRQWNFTRNETLEILKTLDDRKLSFKPDGPNWQDLAFQFGCMAKTQAVYAKAISEGRMDYSWFRDDDFPTRDTLKTKAELLEYLEKANKIWTEAIRSKRNDEDFQISWPGFNLNLPAHISTLMSHERIHHGQIISYFTLAGFEFPSGFKDNWAL